MRYNRLTKEAELSVSDLAGRRPADDKAIKPEDLINCMVDNEFTASSMCFKYEYNDILYSLNADIVMHGNRLCEFIFGERGEHFPPIMHETVISAYAYCNTHELDSIEIESIAVNSNGESCGNSIRRKNIKALEAFFVRKLAAKDPVCQMLKQRSEHILPQSAQIKFPYPSFRRGQKTMMKECYSAMKHGQRLFVQAPTGIGKTISSLYPAVRLIGEGTCDKIFYLTAKGSTQSEVFKTAGALFEAGAYLRTIVISAKDQICFQRDHMVDGMCDAAHCQYSKAPEDSLVGAINELLALQNGYERNIIGKMASKWNICPYELTLALAEYCEIIIADYNYVFDPLVYLRRFFDEKHGTSKYLFLIDEAHNLADRAREMYSAELSDGLFDRVLCSICNDLPELSAEIASVIKEIKGLQNLCADSMVRDEQSGIERGYYLSRNRYESLDIKLEELYNSLSVYLRRGPASTYYRTLFPLSRIIRKYLISETVCPDNIMFYCEAEGDNVMFKSICIDPSTAIDLCMQRAHAALLFSATLTPVDYFIDILGGGSNARSLAVKSPFDEDNLFIAAVDDISTRYEDREESLSRVVSYIAATVSCRKGNYMVYFPSYDYMTQAAEAFGKKYPGVKLLMQKRRMSYEERKDYLNEFRLGDGKMRVGFCVLGGGFSEGIDLPGSSLIGVVIVGVGTPGISAERNIMRDYFDITREMGYHYAYTYPGMNNVLQASGRVIRSDTDCGVVVLIDDRYSTPQYISMYPEHWAKMKHFCQPASLNGDIKTFWSDADKRNAKFDG